MVVADNVECEFATLSIMESHAIMLLATESLSIAESTFATIEELLREVLLSIGSRTIKHCAIESYSIADAGMGLSARG